MARKPSPLPRLPQTFTVPEALAAGVARKRLRAQDILRSKTGVYSLAFTARWKPDWVGDAMSIGDFAEIQALSRRYEGCVVSHVTALRLLGLPVPRTLDHDRQIHFTTTDIERKITRRGITAHRRTIDSIETRKLDQLLLTAPRRLWRDMASVRQTGLEDIVVLGDALVRWPHPREARGRPWATPEELAAEQRRWAGQPGSKLMARALAEIRIGADSPAETRVRRMIRAAGFPEPRTQVPLDPHRPQWYRADLGYEDLKIAMQYEGVKYHSSEDARLGDRHRDQLFQDAGWVVLHIFAHDVRNGLREVLPRLARCMRERGERSV